MEIDLLVIVQAGVYMHNMTEHGCDCECVLCVCVYACV